LLPVRSTTKRGCRIVCQAFPGTEVSNDHLGRGETSVALAESSPDAVIAEANEVSLAITGQVGQDSLVHVGAPALIVAKVGNHEIGRLKAAITVTERSPHAIIAKTDDVGALVAREIGQYARMVGDGPSLVNSKVRQYEFGGFGCETATE
jgi:hypothetical protein